MKCPFCEGRRTMFTREQPGVGTQFGEIKLVVCPKCKGTGEIEEKKPTNFQRITSNPEALADFIAWQLSQLNDIHECDIPIDVDDNLFKKEFWLEWLKQHKE